MFSEKNERCSLLFGKVYAMTLHLNNRHVFWWLWGKVVHVIGPWRSGLTLQRQHAVGGKSPPEVERHPSANRHQSPEMQLGTMFDPSWVPHTEHERPLCSTVASHFFCRRKSARTEDILASRLPREATDCYIYRPHCWTSQSSIIFYY